MNKHFPNHFSISFIMHVNWMDHLKWVERKDDDDHHHSSILLLDCWKQLRWEEMQRLSIYLYLFSYVRFPTDHSSEMSPVVDYVLVNAYKRTNARTNESAGGERERRWRLSTHYVTSHPRTNETKINTMSKYMKHPWGVFNCISLSLSVSQSKWNVNTNENKKSSR